MSSSLSSSIRRISSSFCLLFLSEFMSPTFGTQYEKLPSIRRCVRETGIQAAISLVQLPFEDKGKSQKAAQAFLPGFERSFNLVGGSGVFSPGLLRCWLWDRKDSRVPCFFALPAEVMWLTFTNMLPFWRDLGPCNCPLKRLVYSGRGIIS